MNFIKMGSSGHGSGGGVQCSSGCCCRVAVVMVVVVWCVSLAELF